MYGRNKESEQIRSLIERTYNVHQQEKRKAQYQQQQEMASSSSSTTSIGTSMTRITSKTDSEIHLLPTLTEEPSSINENTPLKEADNLLRINSSMSLDHTACEVIVIKGPGGIGKSTLISTLNVQARHCGYTASAKFDKNQKRPYNGLLKCLSSILRQLLTESEHVIRDFYKDLKHNLGPQFSNVRLMVGMVPELKPILYDYRERVNPPDDDALLSILNTETRFHAVSKTVFDYVSRPIY
jgi:predicted ATPase